MKDKLVTVTYQAILHLIIVSYLAANFKFAFINIE